MQRLRTKRRFSIAAITLGAAIVAASLGCTRKEHIRDDFGVQTRAFFDSQASLSDEGDTQGLDSEEAALIHSNYRENMGQSGRQTRGDPSSSVLILEDGYGTSKRK